MKYLWKRYVSAYMTVEAALVMSVVIMVYVFLIDCMIYQYERCVAELEGARKNVLGTQQEELMYETSHVNPMMLLRLQRLLEEKQKEEEKVE